MYLPSLVSASNLTVTWGECHVVVRAKAEIEFGKYNHSLVQQRLLSPASTIWESTNCGGRREQSLDMEAANMLNKQSQATRSAASVLGFVERLTTPQHYTGNMF